MQSATVFLDIAIFADFGEKMLISAELKRCHVIHIFFGSSFRYGITLPSFIGVTDV